MPDEVSVPVMLTWFRYAMPAVWLMLPAERMPFCAFRLLVMTAWLR